MTPREASVIRNLEARLREAREKILELDTELADTQIELRREKRTRRKAVTRATRAREDSMFLHGVVLLNDIALPERMTA